jgi:hypothetical protein
MKEMQINNPEEASGLMSRGKSLKKQYCPVFGIHLGFHKTIKGRERKKDFQSCLPFSLAPRDCIPHACGTGW